MKYKLPKIIDCRFDLEELQIINYALKFMINEPGATDFIRPLYDRDDNLTDGEIKNDLIRIKGMISGFERMSSAEKPDVK